MGKRISSPTPNTQIRNTYDKNIKGIQETKKTDTTRLDTILGQVGVNSSIPTCKLCPGTQATSKVILQPIFVANRTYNLCSNTNFVMTCLKICNRCTNYINSNIAWLAGQDKMFLKYQYFM